MCLIDALVETEAVGNLLIAGIAQHGVAAADQDGNLVVRDVKAIEQTLRVRVAVEVEISERVPVARQEFLDPKRSRGMHRADQHDVADAVRRQLQPAIDVGPHQNLADLGVRLHETLPLLPRQLDHFPRLGDASARQRAATEEHIGFARELAGSMDGDQRVAEVRRPDNLDLAGLDDKERHDGIAGLDEHVSARDRTHHAMRGDPRDLRGCQGREHERLVRGAQDWSDPGGLRHRCGLVAVSISDLVLSSNLDLILSLRARTPGPTSVQ